MAASPSWSRDPRDGLVRTSTELRTPAGTAASVRADFLGHAEHGGAIWVFSNNADAIPALIPQFGQEAGLFEFLGRSPERYDNHDNDDIARWVAWNEGIRRHGWAPPLRPVPAADPILGELSGIRPWAYSGDQFWVWQEGAWAVADPQPPDPDPEHPGHAWPGTICIQRGHHLLANFGSITACEDCHYVS